MIIFRKGRPFEVLYDDVDQNLIDSYHWNILKSSNQYYAHGYKKDVLFRNQKRILLHRLLMAAPDGIQVDHDNRNGLDCRRFNMRFITHGGNCRNCVKKNKSGYTGVTINGNKYQASIRINNERIILGQFNTAKAAGNAYQKSYEKQLRKEIIICRN